MKEKHWHTIESEEYIIIMPDNDIKPHGERVTDEKYDINTILCACRPEIQYEEGDAKKVVIHNAWDGREWEELASPLS